MIIKIQDPFDKFMMEIDLGKICALYGQRVKVDELQIQGDGSHVWVTKHVIAYPTSKVKSLFDKVCHAYEWDILETDIHDITDFLQENGPKDIYSLWQKALERWRIKID